MYPSFPVGKKMHEQLNKSIPMLPGMSFDFNIGENRYAHKSLFEVKSNQRIFDVEKDTRMRSAMFGTLPGSSYLPSCYTKHPKAPSWMWFDKQVLRFDAHYQESIPESPLENYRLHNCRLLFYLEDDTIQVLETKAFNSGFPQGQVIRRHRVPIPSCQGQYYSIEHFNVGVEIELYGKMFFITACDPYTRKFLTKMGVTVPPDMEKLKDPGTEDIADRRRCQFARKPRKQSGFDFKLEHSTHVLRFWAYWDNRDGDSGDVRHFVVHYFLSNGTMEVRELVKPNAGYQAYPMFLRRQKVPKKCEDLVGMPGAKSKIPILNVFGSIYGQKNKRPHYLIDNLGTGQDVEYYTDRDLAIGATLNILGRAFILVDCDGFTKQYYKEKYGVESFTPLELHEDESDLVTYPKPEPPPYNGWGTEDDSLQSWRSLELKPQIKNIVKAVELRRDVLRFRAQFYNALQKVNQERRFFISYHMCDDTLEVYEKRHPNSGFPQGKFLVRQKIKKPGYHPEIGMKPEYYTYKDFYLGNVLVINGFEFQLTGSDEFTQKYMEERKDKFLHSNVEDIIDKVREAFNPIPEEEVVKAFSSNDPGFKGTLRVDIFRCLVEQITRNALSEQQIQTLCRAFAIKHDADDTVDLKTVQCIVQTELRRYHFDKMLLERVEYTIRHHDPCRSGMIDRETLRSLLRGSKLPLYPDILDFLVYKFPAAENDDFNRVDYCELLRFLDWEDNPVPLAAPAAIKCALKHMGPSPPPEIQCINYRGFLEEVNPNFKSTLPGFAERVAGGTAEDMSKEDASLKAIGLMKETEDHCLKKDPTDIGDCEPLEPITIKVKPQAITVTKDVDHVCAPGADTCNVGQDE